MIYHNHFLQPLAYEMIAATKDVFGNSLILYECQLADFDKNSGKTMAEHAAQQCGAYRSGEDYLIGISLLSKCDSVLISGNSGSSVALIMNGCEYENIFLIDKGKAN